MSVAPAAGERVGKRSSLLACSVFGVPSPRWLAQRQRWLIHEAVRECDPAGADELAWLARVIADAHSRSELRAAAQIVQTADLGPARLRLLRVAYNRIDRSLRIIVEAMGEGPWSR